MKNGWGWANLAVGIVATLYPMVLYCLDWGPVCQMKMRLILPFVLPAVVPLIASIVLLDILHAPNKFAWLGVAGLLIGIAGLAATEQRRSYIREVQDMIACESNMIQLDGAKEQWAMANKLPEGTPSVTNEVVKYLMGHIMPPCPTTKTNTYTLGKIGEKPSCSVHGVEFDVHLPNGKKPVWW